jgi:hypothetical protein
MVAPDFSRHLISAGKTLQRSNAFRYAAAGDRDKAFEYLERAYSEDYDELLAVIRSLASIPSTPIPAGQTC